MRSHGRSDILGKFYYRRAALHQLRGPITLTYIQIPFAPTYYNFIWKDIRVNGFPIRCKLCEGFGLISHKGTWRKVVPLESGLIKIGEDFFVHLTHCITGVVGASYSTVTQDVSTVLQTFNISMLSYAATSTELSKKKRHPLFARLLPSDDRQASSFHAFY